jgi:hypothetical protein
MWVVAIGFGISCLMVMSDLRAGKGLPMMMGFRAFGGGPFERQGIHTMQTLLALFAGVCFLECVAGLLLWNGSKQGALLALGLLPVGAVFWWGFALPFPPVFALLRTILILFAWRTLR